MTFTEFVMTYADYLANHPEQRAGQALTNCLRFTPETAHMNRLLADCDPFYNDALISPAWTVLALNWTEVPA